MRALLLFFAIWQVCAAGRLQILIPEDHPLDNEHRTFDSKSLLEFNKKELGIQTGPGATPSTSAGKLFEKPKALVVISIKGLDDFTYDGHVFNFTDNFKSHGIKDDLKEHFGDNMMHVDLNSSGIFGTPHFKRNTQSFDFNGTDANQDIENMHKLAKLIKEKDRKNANVVDYYRIHLDVSNARSDLEKKQLEENLKRGIDSLQDAIKDSRGGNIIAEIYTHEQVSEKASFEKLQDIRRVYQVTRPRFHDYPATFAICLFVCLSILFGATSMVWFMMDDGDMGKNSLVYRLSTGRQKKD